MNKLIKKSLALSFCFFGIAPLVNAQKTVHEAGFSANSFGLGIFYGYQINDQWTLRAQLNGSDFQNTDVEISGLDYEGEGESSSVSLGVDWRPFSNGWAKKIFFSGGLISTEYDFNGDATAVIGEIIDVGGAIVRADTIAGLNVDIESDQKISPYLSIGWRSKASSEAGLAFTVELGALNLDDPEVTIMANDPNNLLSQTNLDRERDEIKDDLGGMSGYASVGISYRF